MRYPLSERLEAWVKDEEAVAKYRQASYLLSESGVIDILRRVGIPVIFDNGANVDVMAGQAHYAAGYQAALDHIRYFEETFVSERNIHVLSPPDFGAEAEALRRGHLRPEDIK